jgi:peptide/nickel transport system permease protein
MSDHVAASHPSLVPPALRPRVALRSGLARAAALALPLGIIGFCFLGPLAWPHDPAAINPALVLQAPSALHPAGTDALGRDQLARLMQGGAATLLVAGPAAALAFGAGTAYGLISGLSPHWVDATLMRVLDAILALPALVVLIALAALMDLNESALILLLGAVAWAPLARLARNEVMAIKGRDFIQVSQQMGGGFWHLARVHMLPVMQPVLLVNFTLLVGDCIALISALGFLGLGVQPPRTSWGQLLQEGLLLVDLHPWWLVAPPGLLIAASLIATSLAGGALLPSRPAR